MDSTETIQSGRKDLAEIEKIFSWMEKSREISQIDIDVLLNKTRHLYTSVMNLPVGRFDSQPELAIKEVSEPAKPIPEPVPEPQPEPTPEPVFEPEFESELEPFTEAEPWEIPEPVKEPEPIPEPVPVKIPEPIEIPVPVREPEPKPEPQTKPIREPDFFNFPYNPPTPKPERQPVRETVSEISLFQRDGSLNDALGKQKPVHDIASSITDIPVADIWSAITINERFLFIRELFGNDPEGFKNTVTLLNSLGSWESAKKFMTDRFEWDKNNPVAIDFLNVVRRRFLR